MIVSKDIDCKKWYMLISNTKTLLEKEPNGLYLLFPSFVTHYYYEGSFKKFESVLELVEYALQFKEISKLHILSNNTLIVVKNYYVKKDMQYTVYGKTLNRQDFNEKGFLINYKTDKDFRKKVRCFSLKNEVYYTNNEFVKHIERKIKDATNN